MIKSTTFSLNLLTSVGLYHTCMFSWTQFVWPLGPQSICKLTVMLHLFVIFSILSPKGDVPWKLLIPSFLSHPQPRLQHREGYATACGNSPIKFISSFQLLPRSLDNGTTSSFCILLIPQLRTSTMVGFLSLV